MSNEQTSQNQTPAPPKFTGKDLPNTRFKNYEFVGPENESTQQAKEEPLKHRFDDIEEESETNRLPLPPFDAIAQKYDIKKTLPGGFYKRRIYLQEHCGRIPGRYVVEELQASRAIRSTQSGSEQILDNFKYVNTVETKREKLEMDKVTYLVVGIFSRANPEPEEICIPIFSPRSLFLSLSWAIVRLRGMGFLLSLKEVKKFSLYKCNWEAGHHSHIILSTESERVLYHMWLEYSKWYRRREVAEQWTEWIHKNLNNGSYDPLHHQGGSFSLEIVLGWSAFRISIVVLTPIFLSLSIGLWFQSRDPTDLVTIQTAWGIASYVVTAGGLFAALLGVVSSIEKSSASAHLVKRRISGNVNEQGFASVSVQALDTNKPSI